MPKTIVSKVPAGEDIRKSIKDAVDILGGFSKFIKKGDRVLVKPNFNTDDEPPACSRNDFIVAAIGLIKEAGAGKIILGESSWFRGNTQAIMNNRGIIKEAEKAGAEFVNFDRQPWIEKKVDGKYMKKFYIAEELTKADKIVFLPCIKTHKWARFTLSLKLGMGAIKSLDRIKMHTAHLEEKVADMNLAFKPDLIIMDGRICFVTGGPSHGDRVCADVVMASTDRVAIDAEALKILKSYDADNRLDMDIWEFPQIKNSAELGIGANSENDYVVKS